MKCNPTVRPLILRRIGKVGYTHTSVLRSVAPARIVHALQTLHHHSAPSVSLSALVEFLLMPSTHWNIDDEGFPRLV